MSNPSLNFTNCMRGRGLPLPTVDSLNEAKDFIEQLHSAWEAAGGEAEITIAALVALGAATGVDETFLAALGGAAAITVSAYLGACFGCFAAVGVGQLRQLFAENPPQPFMVDRLGQLGIDATAGDGQSAAA
jgi:hypothetical protein